MATPEIGQRDAVDHRALGRAQGFLQNGGGIGTGYRVHGVKFHAEARGKERPQFVEIKQRFHQVVIAGNRIHNFNLHCANSLYAVARQTDIGHIGDPVFLQHRRLMVDRTGDAFRGRPAIGNIELDAKIFINAAGVVAGRQDDAAIGLVQPDQMRCRRRGQQAISADDQFSGTIGCRHFDDGLDRRVVEKTAVTTKHKGLVIGPRRWR